MDYLFLVVGVLAGTMKSVVTRCIRADGFLRTMLVNAATFFVAFVVIFLSGFSDLRQGIRLPWPIVIGNALSIFFSQIALLKAIEYGGMALSTLFYSCGFVISTAWGCVRYAERLNAFHVIGVIAVVASLALVVKREPGRPFRFRWLIFAVCGMIFSGFIGITQKLFVTDYAAISLNVFLCAVFAVNFVISGILCAIFFFAKNRRTDLGDGEEKRRICIGRKSVICTIALGLILGIGNKLNTYLAGALPSVIVFPVLNGGTIVLSAIVSAIVFKEKLAVIQKIGIAVCVFAILCIACGQYAAG